MAAKTFSLDDAVWFYRQPDGCLEIGQNPTSKDDGTGPPDLIHICSDDVPQFLAELSNYAEDTKPYGPSHSCNFGGCAICNPEVMGR